eukprot:jgi/Picsp_1/3206/NSC_06046-R1_pleckstrin homology domain family a
MKQQNVFDRASAQLDHVKSQTSIETEAFLNICREVIPIISNLGTGFAIVKSDIGGNIDRLQARLDQNPGLYGSDLFSIILEEHERGISMDSTSCTKGLLWLKRAMEFIITLLQNVQENKTARLSEIASETYYNTLQQYHGWIVTGTFTVVLKFVPSREAFLETILLESEQCTPPCLSSDADNELIDKERIDKELIDKGQMEARLNASMSTFCSKFQNLLQEIHDFLDSKGLDDPTKV